MSQIKILVAGIVILCIIIFFVFSNKEDTPESTNTPQSSDDTVISTPSPRVISTTSPRVISTPSTTIISTPGVSPLVTDTSKDYDFDSIVYDGVSSELNINS